MSKQVQVDIPRVEVETLRAEGLLRGSSVVDAGALSIIGVFMLVMSILTPIGVGIRIAEIALSGGMLLAGVLLWRAVLTKKRATLHINLLPGEVALAAALLYLGVAMPTFHQGVVPGVGAVSYSAAVIQFIAVLAGLVFGSMALVLSGATRNARPAGKIAPAAIVCDSVILITGTILLAIALGQLPGNALKPPLWNWISFVGITIPGMLLLLVREGVKEGTENWGRSSRFRAVLRLGATEILLIIGLAIMLFGSYANLNLGLNGYVVGIKGNTTGLILLLAAALFLVFVRGFFKLAFVQGSTGQRFANKLLYVVGVIAFIYGERSVLSGHAPLFAAGAAAPTATLILFGALLVLVVGRVFDQKIAV